MYGLPAESYLGTLNTSSSHLWNTDSSYGSRVLSRW